MKIILALTDDQTVMLGVCVSLALSIIHNDTESARLLTETLIGIHNKPSRSLGKTGCETMTECAQLIEKATEHIT